MIGILVTGRAWAVDPPADEKPDLDLPEVVIEGVDQSVLGVGDLPPVGDPQTGALPLPDPPLGDPRDVMFDMATSRTTFGSAPVPSRPTPLTVRSTLTGGSFRTIRVGVDAMREVSTGGIFADLAGVGSRGHLDDAGWTRARARVGGVFDGAAGGVVRGQLRYRAREQDLPVSGLLTDDLGVAGRTQVFRRWGGDVQYLYDESVDYRAEVKADVTRSSFRSVTGGRSQSFVDGTFRAQADVPMPGRLWRLSASVAGGGRTEEALDGDDRKRTRVAASIIGRVGDENGFGLEAGLGFARFGGDDVLGPQVTLFHQFPPTRRVWIGVEPFLREPDLLGFLDATSFASGAVGQRAEVADFRLHGGAEWKPNPLVTLEASSGLRRSEGYAHADVDPDRPGLYELATLDRRYVYDISGTGSVDLMPGLVGDVTVEAELVEGRRVAYVSEHRLGFGVHYRGGVEADAALRFAGPMWGSPDEGSPRLDGAWLFSMGVGMEIVPRTWLTVEARNVLDDNYVTLAEYASEGRRIDAGFRYAF